MLEKLKLRMARRELNLALKYEEQCRHAVAHLQSDILPGLRRRVQAAELALLDDNYQAALADPRTPADQSRRLVEIALQRKQELLGS